MKILLVEDELKVSAFLKKGLEEFGFQVSVAWDLAMARNLLKESLPDLILLDLNLPDGNGMQFCHDIRVDQIWVPVIMLTARSGIDDKLAGFDAGADDYLPKPFEFTELLARVRALLRRSAEQNSAAPALRVADLEMDHMTRSVKRNGKSIDLTVKEYGLLELLMRNAGKVLDRGYIYERIWDVNYETQTNAVDIYIHFLRKKVDTNSERKLIRTIKGQGYMLAE